jgi:hypothetical protein
MVAGVPTDGVSPRGGCRTMRQQRSVMKISVLGLGYVGTVTAGCLAQQGHDVVGVDPEPRKVDLVNAGQSPIIEKDIGKIIGRQVAAGRLAASIEAVDARGVPQHDAARHHARGGDPGARGGLGAQGGRRVRRVHQSRVPARRQRGARLLPPAQDGDRRAQRGERQAAGEPLRAPRGAPGSHRPRDRRDGQVRRQRLARAEGGFRQRDRQRVPRRSASTAIA